MANAITLFLSPHTLISFLVTYQEIGSKMFLTAFLTGVSNIFSISSFTYPRSLLF